MIEMDAGRHKRWSNKKWINYELCAKWAELQYEILKKKICGTCLMWRVIVQCLTNNSSGFTWKMWKMQWDFDKR